MSADELCNLWTDALRSADIPADLQRGYAQSLAKEYITLEQGRNLSDEHLTQVGIRIGHRQTVPRLAANYLVALAVILAKGGLTAQLHLTSKAIDGITRVPRTTQSGITWESFEGSAADGQTFIAFMQSVVVEYCFPLSFNKCFEDNKPMPFAIRNGSSIALLLRIPDLSNKIGTTLATITNRVVILVSGSNMMTYHRCAINPFQELEGMFHTERGTTMEQGELLEELVRCVLNAYIDGHAQLQSWCDEIDEVSANAKIEAAEEFTQLQKQASVYNRCITSNTIVVKDVLEEDEQLEKVFQDVLKDMETTTAKITEVQENAVGSIDLLIALDDFKNSSNLKLFTLISVICQPIGVATGWYGMNFANMPELKFHESYFVFITVILSLCSLIVFFLVFHAYKK